MKGTPRSQGHGKGWHDEDRMPINGFDSYSESNWSEATPLSSQGLNRPDQVFDLSMDYEDDEDVLLDWESYARNSKRVRCCGLDCTWVARALPCCPFVAPEWWYRYSQRQRKVILGCIGGLLGALLLLLAATVFLGVQLGASGFSFGSNSSGSSNGGGGADAACSWSDFRLPDHVRPTAYNLSIEVDMQPPYQVVGQADIGVAVTAASRCIVLHAVHMDVVLASFGSLKGTWKQSQAQPDQLVLRFPQPLQPQQAGVLSLQFRYRLRASLSGFYLASNTTGADGAVQAMAITDFEATSARKAFPCFDEPQLKAPFQLTLTAPSGLAALSNTPEVGSQTAAGGRTRHAFQQTPPMSTYLFAMVVGNLSYVHWSVPAAAAGGAERVVRVWGTPDRSKAELDAAAQVAATLLPFYEELFGMEYPLGKLDLVAVPNNAGGAMENWGLITFRDSYLLADPQRAGLQEQLEVASIVAHEMCHMWFGDTVTPRFWGELWLAEGPATYFENVGGEAAAAGSGFLDRFYADSVTRYLDDDAASGESRPVAITTGVDSDDVIESFFDPVTYEKGASLLRMVRAVLARDAESPGRLRRLQSALPFQQPGGPDRPLGHGRSSGGSGRDISRMRRATLGSQGSQLQHPAVGSAASSSSSSSSSSSRSGPGGSSSSSHQNSSSGSGSGKAQESPGSASSGSSSGGGNGEPADTFIQGLRLYLQRQRFGNANSTDLWGAIADASGKDVVRWLDAWTYQPGFPLVTLRLSDANGSPLKSSSDEQGDDGDDDNKGDDDNDDDDDDDDGDDSSSADQGSRLYLTAEQAPFAQGDNQQCRTPWWLPIAYMGSSGNAGVSGRQWLDLDQCNTGKPLLEIPTGDSGWVKVNTGQLVPMRVNYPKQLWRRLAIAAADPDAINQVDMAGLLDDAWAIAKAGHGRIRPFLDLTRSLGQRGLAEYSPWTIAARHLQAADRLLGSKEQHGKQHGCRSDWRKYVRKQLLGPALLTVRADSTERGGNFSVGPADATELRLIRPRILKLAGNFGDEPLQQEAAQRVTAAGGVVSIRPDLQAVAWQLAVQGGSQAAFDTAVTTYKHDASPIMRDQARAALGAAADERQLEAVLRLTLSPALRQQDVAPLLTALLDAGGEAAAAALDFLERNLDHVYNKLGGTVRAAGQVADLVVAAAEQLSGSRSDKRIVALFDRFDPILPRKPYLGDAQAAIAANDKWLAMHADKLCGWLDDL